MLQSCYLGQESIEKGGAGETCPRNWTSGSRNLWLLSMFRDQMNIADSILKIKYLQCSNALNSAQEVCIIIWVMQ